MKEIPIILNSSDKTEYGIVPIITNKEYIKEYRSYLAECWRKPIVDSPRELWKLTEEEREALLYWIKIVIQPYHTLGTYGSYVLKHRFGDYLSDECTFYITNGQFKGAMLYSGYLPSAWRDLNWRFCERPRHNVVWAKEVGRVLAGRGGVVCKDCLKSDHGVHQEYTWCGVEEQETTKFEEFLVKARLSREKKL